MSNLSEEQQERLRSLPSVDSSVVGSSAGRGDRDFRAAIHVVEVVRKELDKARGLILNGGVEDAVAAQIVESVVRTLREPFEASLRPVINATGVVIHTNLGRAPVSEAAGAAMADAARGYSNLEYDLEAGARGSRTGHLEFAVAVGDGRRGGDCGEQQCGGVVSWWWRLIVRVGR